MYARPVSELRLFISATSIHASMHIRMFSPGPLSPTRTGAHARLQIWDVTHGRLCVSGAHNKMAPKLPTPAPSNAVPDLEREVGRARL